MKHTSLTLFFFLIFTITFPLFIQAQVTDKAKLAEFEEAITKGEEYLQVKDYAKAKVEYQKALTIDPQAKYPKDKLAQIRKVYIDPKDETDFNLAVSKGDQLMNSGKYEEARKEYSSALIIKPDDKSVKEKIASADKASNDKNTKLKEYSTIVSEADRLYGEKKYNDALSKYKLAEPLNPTDNHSKNRISEIENILAVEQGIKERYDAAIGIADEAYMNRDFALAKSKYEEASKIKPGETYPKSMLDRVIESIANKSQDDLVNEKKRVEDAKLAEIRKQDSINAAIKSQKQAEEAQKLADAKLAEEQKLADAKLAEEKKIADAILAEEQKLADAKLIEEQKLADAKLSEEKKIADAKLAEEERLAEEQRLANEQSLAEETQRLADIKKEEDRQALIAADKLAEQQKEQAELDAKILADKKAEEERLALLDAEKLVEERRQDSLKAIEKAVRDEEARIAEAKILEDEKTRQLELEKASETDKAYYELVEAGNNYYTLQDLPSAVIMYERASELKPFEEFPKDRIIYINNILLERLKNNLESYNKHVAAGDLAFQSNIFDKALEDFEKATLARPDQRYPSMMIERIKKLMEDNALIELSTDATLLTDSQEKRYNFKPVDMKLRKNNYLLIKAKKTSERAPKVFINYGKDASKSGGFVLKGIESDESSDYLLRISIQDKWYRVDNNWISVYPEGGDIEITSIQISQGDIETLK